MGLFWKEKNKDELIAIFDIGSGSIGGALVKFENNDNGILVPSIIAETRTDISFRDELDFNQFVMDMEQTLFQVATDLYSMKKGAPDKVYCYLSSPWYISETKTLNLNKPTPFVVTKKLMKGIIEEEKKNLINSYNEKYAQDIKQVPKLIESICMHSKVNGYIVRDPVGKIAKDFSIHMYVSLSPDFCLNKIRSSIEKVFHHTPVSFGTSMAALYFSATEYYVSAHTALLISIGSEITDIGVVGEGVLSNVISFPYGTNTIKRILKGSTKLDEPEIASSLELLSHDKLEKGAYDVLLPGLKVAEKDWEQSFKHAIDQLPKGTTLPANIFMVTDPCVAPWFKRMIESQKNIQNIMSQKQFSVITMNGVDLLNVCKVNSPHCDQFLMMEAIAYRVLNI